MRPTKLIAYVENEREHRRQNGLNCSVNLASPTTSPTFSKTYYYETDTLDSQYAFNYIPITNTTSGTYPGGNYAVFTGLTASTFTLTLSNLSKNSGVMGLEIINTPLSVLNRSPIPFP